MMLSSSFLAKALSTRGPTRAEKAYEISKSFDFSDFYSDFRAKVGTLN